MPVSRLYAGADFQEKTEIDMKTVKKLVSPLWRTIFLVVGVFSVLQITDLGQSAVRKAEAAPALAVHTVTAVGATVQPGQQVFVSIELESAGDEVAGSFTVTFDQTKLSISGISSPGTNPDVTLGTGTPAGSALTVNANQVLSGRIGFLVDSTNSFAASPPNRQIVRLRFTAASNAAAGPTTISFGNVPTPKSFSDGLGNPIPTTFVDGTVTIQAAAPPVSVSGQVTSPAGTGLRNAIVTMVEGNNRYTATTSTFGYYSFSNIPSGFSYTIGVTSRKYTFTPVTMTISNDVTNLNFVGQ